eukprot:SAG22_NODE_500_length_9715_cov_29.986793_7_plen_33_part_00
MPSREAYMYLVHMCHMAIALKIFAASPVIWRH